MDRITTTRAMDALIRRYNIRLTPDGALAFDIVRTDGWSSRPVDPTPLIMSMAADIIAYLSDKDVARAAEKAARKAAAEAELARHIPATAEDLLSPAAIYDLPPFETGSPKQIIWAEDLRRRAYGWLARQAIAKSKEDAFRRIFWGQEGRDASYWIDNRCCLGRLLDD